MILTLIFVRLVTAHSFCRSNVLQNSVFLTRFVGEVWLKFIFLRFRNLIRYAKKGVSYLASKQYSIS